MVVVVKVNSGVRAMDRVRWLASFALVVGWACPVAWGRVGRVSGGTL